jgi:hypothetical protein
MPGATTISHSARMLRVQVLALMRECLGSNVAGGHADPELAVAQPGDEPTHFCDADTAAA